MIPASNDKPDFDPDVDIDVSERATEYMATILGVPMPPAGIIDQVIMTPRDEPLPRSMCIGTGSGDGSGGD